MVLPTVSMVVTSTRKGNKLLGRNKHTRASCAYMSNDSRYVDTSRTFHRLIGAPARVRSDKLNYTFSRSEKCYPSTLQTVAFNLKHLILLPALCESPHRLAAMISMQSLGSHLSYALSYMPFSPRHVTTSISDDGFHTAIRDIPLLPHRLTTTSSKPTRSLHGACTALSLTTMSNESMVILLDVIFSCSYFAFGVYWFISNRNQYT